MGLFSDGTHHFVADKIITAVLVLLDDVFQLRPHKGPTFAIWSSQPNRQFLWRDGDNSQ
jgi:hypothetical protein